MESISVSYAGNMWNQYLENYGEKASRSDGSKSFSELAGAESRKGDKALTAAGKTGKKEMTTSEYKQYITGQISRMPVSLTQSKIVFSIKISDAGLEAMKKDPQYEKQILDSLRADFAYYDPSGNMGSGFANYYIGPTKEDCVAEVWSYDEKTGLKEKLFEEDSKEGFWERRMRRHKEIMEDSQEFQKERAVILKKTQQQNILRVAAGLDEKAPYLAGVPACELLSLLG